ncbi:DM13 domain-containing protein [Thalassotalea sp. PLHSN55]|uniref:DM13 domain-containing protein n=1 Tax=Thalassotalea sp. PLHSN55 TaxID=3435888 RepID=UPI003F848B4B
MKYVFLLSLVFGLSACGGGSSDGEAANNSPEAVTPVPDNSTPDTSAPEVFTGQFIDAAVSGLQYQTNTASGTTNSAGEFTYLANESITFSIGGINFPTVNAQTLVTPLTLFSTDDINDTQVVNSLRLLQSLDQDGDLSNGIHIPDAIHQAAENLTLDFSAANFAEQVESLLADNLVFNMSLITADDAIYHFEQSLAQLNQDNNGSCEKTHAMVGWSGFFSTQSHNVAGKATVIDDCTIEVSQFYYDGGGPEVYFYAAKNNDFASDQAFAISSRITGTVYENNTFPLKLPNGKTLDDLTGLSVWCVDFAVSFGEMEFSP